MNEHGYFGKNGGRLKYSDDAHDGNFMGFQSVKVLPFEMNGPAAQRHRIGDRVENSRFPRSVGADQAEQLSPVDVEIDLVDGLQISKVNGYVFPSQQGRVF
jgi:hypothetical protein